jgi:hypothetical protein
MNSLYTFMYESKDWKDPRYKFGLGTFDTLEEREMSDIFSRVFEFSLLNEFGLDRKSVV